MEIYYSATRNGFFSPEYHSTLPDDAVELTAERHAELIAGQESGLQIIAGDDGHPALRAYPAPPPMLSRAAFAVALTKTTPPILTGAEALAALEAFPPKFAAALADKPLEYQAAAIEAWRNITSVSRDAPLFLDLLAFYAGQAGLSDAQSAGLGDAIFAGAGNAG